MKHTCCFRFSSAHWTPVNVEPSEASLKWVNKKDLISAAGEKHCLAAHNLSGNIWVGNGGISMGWQDEHTVRKSRWGQRKWHGHCNTTLGIVLEWPLKWNTKVSIIMSAKVLTYCMARSEIIYNWKYFALDICLCSLQLSRFKRTLLVQIQTKTIFLTFDVLTWLPQQDAWWKLSWCEVKTISTSESMLAMADSLQYPHFAISATQSQCLSKVSM